MRKAANAVILKINQVGTVTEIYDYVIDADRVVFYVGRAVNPASYDISFKQMGLLSRTKIVPMLADKLRRKGKLVLMEFI